MTCNYLSKFISCIKQASLKNSLFTIIEYSDINLDLTKVFFRNGLISHYSVYIKNKDLNRNISNKVIIMYFKIVDSSNTIRNIQMLSKPGRRIYIKKKDLFHSYGKFNFCIVSTSMGFYTINELRQIGIGGELLMEIDC
jgi:small subunit ribosomal protein S8